MSNENKNILFTLIKSLSKSEKRQFKLYVGRLGKNEDANYLTLFNVLDKMDEFEEDAILLKSQLKKRQLPNLKANLYKQILTSLRLAPQHQTLNIQIREQLDYATILYNKGLYEQSLKILEKAKQHAIDAEKNFMAYEIVEFEKEIESQYITRSLIFRADNLAIEAKNLSIQNVLASKLSNLSLQLYSFLLRNGYAKNEDDYLLGRNYFYYHLPTFEFEDLGFREKLYLYMSQLWYALIVQDFRGSYKYASKWTDLFIEHPQMIASHPVYYLKGKNHLLESLYYLRYLSKFKSEYQKLLAIEEEPHILSSDNMRALWLMYKTYSKLNLYFLSGEIQEGANEIPKIEAELKIYRNKIDDHHLMVINYKFACMHFGLDQYASSIAYLDKIINNRELVLREDLGCYTRILKLISLFELDSDQLDSFIRNTYRFLIKMNDLHLIQREIILFLRNLNSILPSQLKQAFINLHETLKKLEDHPFEKRSFLYLDIISWLESKIESKRFLLIIQEKAKNLK
ncbi:hypothetical protein [Crocinitomix catalasitica]|uniref:hypothetical protein n=1 Tax=Crocinitomix catalasitica TaxID=184607 RepID=UPI0004847641|nr:hypothetical protein [Crocinitomix catalasitica]